MFRLGANQEISQLSPVELWAGNMLWNVSQQQGAALIPLILTGTLWSHSQTPGVKEL